MFLNAHFTTKLAFTFTFKIPGWLKLLPPIHLSSKGNCLLWSSQVLGPSTLSLKKLLKMDFEHALRIHVTSIWKTLTSRGRQRAWKFLAWKSSKHFIKWSWSNACFSTNVALFCEKGKKGCKEPYSWDKPPLGEDKPPWKKTFWRAAEIQLGNEWWYR